MEDPKSEQVLIRGRLRKVGGKRRQRPQGINVKTGRVPPAHLKGFKKKKKKRESSTRYLPDRYGTSSTETKPAKYTNKESD